MQEQEQNRRVRKINQLLAEEVGKILQREIDIARDMLITITSVKTSSDLQHATIGVTVLPETKEEDVLSAINKQIYFIQKILNRALRMKLAPKLKFEIDKIAKVEQKIYEALEKPI